MTGPPFLTLSFILHWEVDGCLVNIPTTDSWPMLLLCKRMSSIRQPEEIPRKGEPLLPQGAFPVGKPQCQGKSMLPQHDNVTHVTDA